jgi:hypothetical protein
MFQQVMFVKWGSGADEATPRYEEVVAGGRQSRAANRKLVAPLTLRLDQQGRFHLYSPGDGAILARQHAVVGRTSLDASDSEAIDFAPSTDGYHVLFRDPARAALLVSIDRSGAVRWRRNDLASEPDRVVLTPSGLFVGGRLTPESWLQIDAETGSTIGRLELTHVAMRPFIAPDGALVSATYFPELRRRGVLVVDPNTRRETAAVADKQLYGPLTRAFGTDAAHALYLFGQAAEQTSSSVLVIGSDAKLQHSLPLDALFAPGPGRPVVAARFVGSEIHLLGLHGAKSTEQVALPARLRDLMPERLTLIAADRRQLVFDLRDELGFAADRVTLDRVTGAIEPVGTADDCALVPGMQPIETWDVSAEGAVHVPVVSEEGLSVVRIDL